MKNRIKNVLYIIVPILIGAFVLGHDFIWRYESSLHLDQQLEIADHAGNPRTLYVRQSSTSKVDTTSRTFVDMKNGITYCQLWLDGSHDTVRTTATGRYFSELRTFKIATDSSLQAMLIPNSEHGLAPGWGDLVYLTPSDSIRIQVVTNANIGDVDKDGAFELFDKHLGWTKLETATGNWVPIQVKLPS